MIFPETTDSGPETPDKYIRGLMAISQAINSDLYLEDLLRLIVMVTAQVTGVTICSLWLIDDSASPPVIRLRATQAIDAIYVKDRVIPMNEGVVGYVATHKTHLIVRDVLTEKRFKEKDMARKLGLASMLSVPMTARDDNTIGVFNCFTSSPHDFSPTEVDLITTVAHQAAIAIFNQALIVKTRVIQEELETRKRVEKAKEVIMQRKNISGDAAYRLMQKHSMNSRKPLREVADAILLSESVFT